jgi:hypothetical protein
MSFAQGKTYCLNHPMTGIATPINAPIGASARNDE